MTVGRWAIPTLVVVGLAAWVDALAGGHLGSGVLGVVAVAAAALWSGWAATSSGRAVALVLAGLAAATLLAVADQVAAPGQFSLANDGVFYGVLVAGPALAGRLIGDRSRQLAELRRRTAELERRRPAVLRAARSDEAARVERQVDRALAGRLDVVVAGIRTARDDPSRLAEVEDSARAALAELREVLGVLQPDDPPVEPMVVVEPPTAGRLDVVDRLLALGGVPLAVESGDVAISLAQGVLLLVVRRRPVIGSATLLAVSAVQSALLTPVPPLVTWLFPGLLMAYLAGHTRVRRTALIALITALAGVMVVTAVTPAAHRATDSLAPSLAMGILAWWAGRTVAARERRTVELTRVAEELIAVERAEAELAVAEQRAELTRELHDVGAHALTVVCLQAGAAQRVRERDPGQAQEAISALNGLADGTLTAIRRSLGGLDRTQAASSIDPTSLAVLAELGRALGLRVEVIATGRARPLPSEVAHAGYRVIQESLTNAARYAPGGQVRVELSYQADAVDLRIADSGPGCTPASVPVNGAGIGLRGMRVRVEACRGRLDHGPEGAGFLVRAVLPLGAG